jgi:hypothetical protein
VISFAAVLVFLEFSNGCDRITCYFALLSQFSNVNIIFSCCNLSLLSQGISVRSDEDKFLRNSQSAIVPCNDRVIGVSRWL